MKVVTGAFCKHPQLLWEGGGAKEFTELPASRSAIYHTRVRAGHHIRAGLSRRRMHHTLAATEVVGASTAGSTLGKHFESAVALQWGGGLLEFQRITEQHDKHA